MPEKKLNGTVIVTYRCNARCTMCNRYKAPSKPEEEISIETIKKLKHVMVTGEDITFVYNNLIRKYSLSDGMVVANNHIRGAGKMDYPGTDEVLE